MRAPWYFNMREVGDEPDIFQGVVQSIAEMIMLCDDVDLMIGVEMAGLPLVGAIATMLFSMGKPMRFGYTRPAPTKGVTPDKVAEMLKWYENSVGADSYGQKSLVESRIRNNDRVAIVDDMATTIGSKIVARALTLWKAERINAKNVTCGRIFYFLNRGLGNKTKAREFENEHDSALYPAPISADYVIEFDDAMPLLKKVMKPGEYELIREFQANPMQFQGVEGTEGWKNWQKIVEAAARGL